jgi:hypothetical protein
MIFCSFAASRTRFFRLELASSFLLAFVMASGFASSAIAQSPVSDDFNGTSLNTSLWTVEAPAGGSAAVSNGHLVITVPGGSNHDAFKPALDAVQVVQQVSNANFDVNVKIDSTLAASAAYSGQGILVEGDAHDYIRYGVGASGSSITLGANTIVAGTESTPFQTAPFSGYVVPTYLRLNRTGTTYTGYWSTDGVNWTKAGSFTDSSLTVTGLAPYAWNYNITPSSAPAVTASFDWFHNTNAATVATPTFSPASGTSFTSSLSVTINESTSGSTIYYTTDGSTPTTSSQVYSSPITIDASTTMNAIAVASGVSSAVGSASYTLTTAPPTTPTFSPVSGTSFTSTLSVTINESTSGSTIYYTTNGSTPTTSSQVYSSPITISSSTTIKAIAVASGVSSAVGSASYTLNAVTVATPTFSPASGTSFTSTLSVTINESTTGSTIYYTTDGSTPTTSSQVYSSPITISSSTTIKAIAVASGVSSTVGTASYTLTTQAPGAPVADDFNGTSLNTSLWTVEAPAGGSAAVSNGHLVITVPGGSNHDAFKPALDAVQVVQQISNGNFDVNVKIDSTLASSAAYSGQGILVEGDAHDYIRYGVGASGSSITLGANTIIAGTESTPFQLSPFSGYAVPTYLRLNRTGTTYTGYYSADGVNWTKAGSFTDSSLTVTGLAPYGWNYNATPSSAPAVTASFDWFHNTTTTATVATPTFNPASGTSFSSTLSVSIADSTSGSTIYYTTDGSTPTTSSQVYSGAITISASTTIQAMATASGFAPSGIASASYTKSAAVVATPSISPASGTTFTTTLSVSISDSTSGSTIFYTTDGSTPTTSSTVYSGSFTISASTTVQAIATATGLTESGVASASYTLTNETGGVVSDNFDESTLNTSLWTLENPIGDGTVVMTGSGANLNVPMGTNHDLWTSGDNAVRIMQSVSNSNFSVDARFQSAVEIGNQDEGILVEQDSADFLRFDVLFNGTTPELFAAGLNGSKATTFISTPITFAQGPLVLRLARNGNVWTPSYSTDGTNFTTAANFTFDLNAAKVGPYAGASNSTASNSPGFTATVDYFFATSDPIANQDGPKPYGYVTVDANPASTLVEKALADIQGTGHLEPIIGLERESQANDSGASGVYWYSYPSSGNVNGTWVRHTIIGSGDAYEDMVPFDVNGDGAIDIVCSFDPGFTGDPEIVWFENPRGSGGNPDNTWTMHVVGPGLGENNLLIADIDGDGKMDIVTPSSVFFQNSSTSWTQVQYSQSFRGVALLDIGSGKGAVNLAGTQPASPYNVVWWENPRETGGNARTGKWIMHTIGPGYPCSPDNCSTSSGSGEVAAYNATDVNGDGMMDVISGQSEGPGGGIAPPPGGMIWWQAPSDRRNGTWIKHTMDATLLDVHKIQLGDMDKNGTLDIVAPEQDQSPLDRVAVFYNDGKGNLTEQIISNAKGHNDAIGDMIGNGALDILNSGHGYFNDSHPLQIFLNPY